MARQSADHTRIMKFAKNLMLVHGDLAVAYICDRIIENMGGDPGIEDMWHDILNIVYEFEEVCAVGTGKDRVALSLQ